MRRRGAPGFGMSCGSGFGLRGRNILPQKWIELAARHASCRNRCCRLRARSRNVALGRRFLPTSRERQAIADRVAAAKPEALDGSPVTSIGRRDGYKYYAADGSWLLIRFSGTEPLMRIYTEVSDQKLVPQVLQAGEKLAGVRA